MLGKVAKKITKQRNILVLHTKKSMARMALRVQKLQAYYTGELWTLHAMEQQVRIGKLP